MPVAVPPWLHRVCIRDHAPNDPWMKLLLFTVNSFMGEKDDDTFVGQETIARRAGMGISTVRRKSAEASRLGWIAMVPRCGNGQRWKSYTYRPCVPEHVDLASISVKTGTAEELAIKYAEKVGEIDPSWCVGTLYPQKGRRRVPPVVGGSSVEAPPADDHKHRPLANEAPPADDMKHRPPRGEKFLNPKSSLKGFSEEGGLSPTLVCSDREAYENMQAIKSAYPPDAARQDWIAAEKLVRQLVDQGVNWSDIRAGVERYANHCRATNRYVLNPARFFGAPDRPWLQPWPIPKSKAQAAQDANVDAGLEWLKQGAA